MGLQPLVLIWMCEEHTRKDWSNTRFPSFYECLLTPTAEDALVRAMCNASLSAMVGSGQPTKKPGLDASRPG